MPLFSVWPRYQHGRAARLGFHLADGFLGKPERMAKEKNGTIRGYTEMTRPPEAQCDAVPAYLTFNADACEYFRGLGGGVPFGFGVFFQQIQFGNIIWNDAEHTRCRYRVYVINQNKQLHAM